MTSAAEALAAKGPLAAALADGLDDISQHQTIIFTRYTRRVLPLDQYVFWIKSDLLDGAQGPFTITVKGSMHFATDQAQREDETFGQNHMIFTSQQEVEEFNAVNPSTIWLGAFEGVRFAFASRGLYYRQADLSHYRGDAVYPAFETQIIDTLEALEALSDLEPIVTNSLPIWLSLDALVQPYPSFLTAENIVPPYAAIHIPPEGTQVFSAAPVIDRLSNHWQLAKDRVRVTLYGFSNSEALAYLDSVLDFMANGDTMGLLNMPTVRDEKRIQSELTVLAQKKTIEFEVSYYQHAARNIARQLILSCTPTIILGN